MSQNSTIQSITSNKWPLQITTSFSLFLLASFTVIVFLPRSRLHPSPRKPRRHHHSTPAPLFICPHEREPCHISYVNHPRSPPMPSHHAGVAVNNRGGSTTSVLLFFLNQNFLFSFVILVLSL